MTIIKKTDKHWTVPYAWAGHRHDIHIWKLEDGTYMTYAGAVVTYQPTFEAAIKQAQAFAIGCTL